MRSSRTSALSDSLDFEGALECRARAITSEMKLAAAHAIAAEVSASELREDYIIPGIFKSDVASKVAEKVRQAKQ